MSAEQMAAFSLMASGLAHEGRNALQQMGACAEMLAMEVAHMPEALDLVRGVQEAETRLQRMFDDLSAFTGRMTLVRAQADLAEVWRRAWQKMEPNGHSLVEHASETQRHANISQPHVEEAFRRLFDNALEAARDPARVEILTQSATIDGMPAVSISIRDFGPGFSAAALDRALDPFFTTKTQRIGLGLPYVMRVVEAHGGELRIENACEGPGAVVTLVFPRHD